VCVKNQLLDLLLRTKRHDLENLFKYHCTPNAKSRIQKASRKHPDGAVVPSLVICCRHFEKHRHDVAKRKNVHLSLRRTNCLGPFLPLLSDCVESYTPEALKTRTSVKVQQHEIQAKKQAKRKRSRVVEIPKQAERVVRQRQEVDNLQRRRSARLSGAMPSSCLREALERCLAYSQLEDMVRKLPDHTTLPVSLVLDLMAEAKMAGSYSYEAFRKDHRNDLWHCTGFHSMADIETLFINPLLKSYEEAAKKDARKAPRGLDVANRVIWCFMFMWMDDTFQALHRRLVLAGDIDENQTKRKAFSEQLRNTLRDLAALSRNHFPLPEPEQWKRRNVQENGRCSCSCIFRLVLSHILCDFVAGDVYVPSDVPENQVELYGSTKHLLFFVIDGSSCQVLTPTRCQIGRNHFVSYKGHSAHRYFILCTLDGHIVYLSEALPGHMNDDQEYRDSDIKTLLEEKYHALVDEPGIELALGGDKGMKCP